MIEPKAVQKMLETSPDFINLKRFGYSLAKLKERYPDECPPHIIANALNIPEGSIEERYREIVQKLRILMDVKKNG